MLFDQFFHNGVTELGLRSLVRLINDNQIPIHIRKIFQIGLAAIIPKELNGGKIDKRFTSSLQVFKCFSLIDRTIIIPCLTHLHFLEIIKPRIRHNRTMSHDEHSLKGFILDQLQGRQGFTKTHFSIPEHSVFFLKDFLRLLDRCLLFWTKGDNWFFNK